MSMSHKIRTKLPPHLAALQLLVNRCSSAELRKSFIVESGIHGAIEAADAELLISANQLETA